MKISMNKMYASMLVIVLMTGMLAMTINVLPVANPVSGFETVAVPSEESIGSTDNIQENKVPLISLKIGDILLSINIEIPDRHTIITYEDDKSTSTLEFIVSSVDDKFTTTTILNGMIVSEVISEINILSPILKNKPLQKGEFDGYSSLASDNENPGITAQYTYSWWDGVRQVTGPLYLINYHHPDRDYYQIPTWLDWTLNGNVANHYQISSGTASLLITGGWAAIFGAIGAIAFASAGGVGSAAGAFIGAMFGSLFGYITQAQLGDGAGCIWFWCGESWFNWFIANVWWLLLSPIGIIIAGAVFLTSGYLRVGDWTFNDAPGIGNP